MMTCTYWTFIVCVSRRVREYRRHIPDAEGLAYGCRGAYVISQEYSWFDVIIDRINNIDNINQCVRIWDGWMT